MAQEIYEDFTAIDDWTVDSGTWGVSGGVLQQQAASYGGIVCDTELSVATTEWVKVTFSNCQDYQGVILRYTDTNNHYRVYWKHYNDEVCWVRADGFDISCDTLDFGSDGDSMSVTIIGTGDDTVIRVWKNTTNNYPDSATSWDSGAADITLTADPDEASSDTGVQVGIYGYGNTGPYPEYDNFYAGVISAAEDLSINVHDCQDIGDRLI